MITINECPFESTRTFETCTVRDSCARPRLGMCPALNKNDEMTISTITKEQLSYEGISSTLNATIKHYSSSKLATFLSMISTYGRDYPLNCIFKADTSTGKSWIALETASLFPQEDLMVLMKASPSSFYHLYGKQDEDGMIHVDLDRKLVIFKDQPHDLLLDELKPLMRRLRL